MRFALIFCKKIGLNYNTIINKYLNEYSSSNIPIEEAIKEIVDYYIENPPIRTKYFVKGQSMMGFCNENGYPYLSIYRRIKTLESNGNEDNLVEEAIKKYEERLHIDKINSIFSSLDKNVNIEDICKYLKINYDNVLDLIDMSFTIKQAINMIWYF